MSELKIPNLNNKSRPYLFKNKLTIKRKSKRKLLIESLLLFISAFILLFINYIIPEKKFLFYSFIDNFYKLYVNLINFFYYFIQIIIVLLIICSTLLALMLIIGALYRLFKVSRRKTKKFKY